MAQSRHSAVAKDFDDVLGFLVQKLGLPAKALPEMTDTARRIHASTYSLIMWKFRLGKMPDRGRIYIEEIASDALQILPQIMSGFSKTAKLLMRGIIENTLRHIYFYDHPVEFTRINKVGKWHVTVSNMFEFLSAHPEFVLTEANFDALAKLSALYAELSAGIHGRSVSDLETRAALQSIVYDPVKSQEDTELLAKCTASVNFLIAIFHHDEVSAFTPRDRSLILRTMPSKARQVWKEHEPSPEIKAARLG
jgi:hypothetical protein